MMIQFVAMIIGSGVAYVPHLLFGDHMSVMTDFFVGSIIGGAAYVATIYKLKKMRGDF
jgi:hypothetical protein